jgi:hypothetical protein
MVANRSVPYLPTSTGLRSAQRWEPSKPPHHIPVIGYPEDMARRQALGDAIIGDEELPGADGGAATCGGQCPSRGNGPHQQDSDGRDSAGTPPEHPGPDSSTRGALT